MSTLAHKRAKLAHMVEQSAAIKGRNLALTMSIRDLRAEIATDEAGGWTSVRDALPPEDSPMCGFSHTAHVLVSDGYTIELAYLERWDDNEDYPDKWKEVGRDGYDVTFDVLYWRALPPFPEIPTGEQDA